MAAADCVAIGRTAMGGGWDSSPTSKSIAIGTLAMGTGTKNGADNNVAIGYKALEDITTADGITAVGHQALAGLTSGAGNLAIGYQALLTETTGIGNTVIGYTAGKLLAGASYNTVIGREAMLAASGTESNNVAIGQSSMGGANNNSVGGNVAVGRNSMVGGTGALIDNIAIGYFAMDGTGTINGRDNIFMGANAGGGTWVTSESNQNIGIGTSVMDAAMSGAGNNVAIGHYAMSSVTTADDCVALGGGAHTILQQEMIIFPLVKILCLDTRLD